MPQESLEQWTALIWGQGCLSIWRGLPPVRDDVRKSTKTGQGIYLVHIFLFVDNAFLLKRGGFPRKIVPWTRHFFCGGANFFRETFHYRCLKTVNKNYCHCPVLGLFSTSVNLLSRGRGEEGAWVRSDFWSPIFGSPWPHPRGDTGLWGDGPRSESSDRHSTAHHCLPAAK